MLKWDMKSALGFLVLVIAVVGVLLLSPKHRWPALPGDAAHRGAASEAACMGCHGAGKSHPLNASHPPKFSCLKCHKPGKG